MVREIILAAVIGLATACALLLVATLMGFNLPAPAVVGVVAAITAVKLLSDSRTKNGNHI